MREKTASIPSFGRRIQSLDALRGLAIIAVVLYHATPDQATGGILSEFVVSLRSCLWTGVDMFFVLSGFLITRILLETRNRPRYFSVFYARRFLRIFPLYYLFIVTVIFGGAIFAGLFSRFSFLAESESYQRLWQGQVWLWLYLHNFVQAAGPSRLPGMGHLWSLAVEEQFYLVWPLVIWLAPRQRIGILIATLFAIGFLVRLTFSLNGLPPWAIMHLTPFRLDSLLVGSAIAVIGRDANWNAIAKTCRRYLFAVAASVILLVWLWRGTFDWGDPVVQRYGFISFSLFAGCIVHWFIERDKNYAPFGPLQSKDGASKVLHAWGKYSYAIYVFHMPVIHAMKKCCSQLPFGLNGTLEVFLSALVSFSLAYLSWHLYEKHWLKLKPAYR